MGKGHMGKQYEDGMRAAIEKYLEIIKKQEEQEKLLEAKANMELSFNKNPPPYTKIKKNKLHPNLQKTTKEKDPKQTLYPCICTPADGCGEGCLNGDLRIECHPDICPIPLFCENQRFQKALWKDIEIFYTHSKGWAARAVNKIYKGEFVIEYVGEIIDLKTCAERLKESHEQSADKRQHFYFLSLDKDTILDASEKGNEARFLNHSCDPNCETQKWSVRGSTRIGLFAKRNIEPKEELTFDYQFENIDHLKQPCLCGSANCSGFIGEKPAKRVAESTKEKESEKGVKTKKSATKPKGRPKKDQIKDQLKGQKPKTLLSQDLPINTEKDGKQKKRKLQQVQQESEEEKKQQQVSKAKKGKRIHDINDNHGEDRKSKQTENVIDNKDDNTKKDNGNSSNDKESTPPSKRRRLLTKK